MRRAGVQQFSYETLVAAHSADPRLQNIITDFNKEEVVFKQSEVDDLKDPQAGGNSISTMAKRATDVGADL